jgi:hypothetical protein
VIDPVQPVKPVGAVGAKKIKGLPQPRLATPRPKLLTTKGQTPVNPFGANKMTIKAASLSEFHHHQVMRKMAAYDPMAMALLALRDEQEKAAGLNLLDDAVNIGRVVAKGTKGATPFSPAAPGIIDKGIKAVKSVVKKPRPLPVSRPAPGALPSIQLPAAQANAAGSRVAPKKKSPVQLRDAVSKTRQAPTADPTAVPTPRHLDPAKMREAAARSGAQTAPRNPSGGGQNTRNGATAPQDGSIGEAAGMGWRAKAGIGASLLGAGAIGGGMATGGVMAGQQQNQMAMLQRYNQGVR